MELVMERTACLGQCRFREGVKAMIPGSNRIARAAGLK